MSGNGRPVADEMEGNGAGAPPRREKTNYDLLHMDFVPCWFQTEQTLGLPHGQLKEALIHLKYARCPLRASALAI